MRLAIQVMLSGKRFQNRNLENGEEQNEDNELAKDTEKVGDPKRTQFTETKRRQHFKKQGVVNMQHGTEKASKIKTENFYWISTKKGYQ